MFLISAHQTYLNNKILRERLYSSNNLKRPTTTKAITSSTTNIEQVYANNLISTNKTYHLPVQPLNHTNNDTTSCHMQSKRESRLMQRTRKYFTSSGHKFLFNNT